MNKKISRLPVYYYLVSHFTLVKEALIEIGCVVMSLVVGCHARANYFDLLLLLLLLNKKITSGVSLRFSAEVTRFG